jgi:DNA excision repair protein ERCC-2
MIKARKKCEKSGPARHEKEQPDDLYPILRRFLLITERWLTQNIKAAYREELLDLYFSVTGFLRVAEQFDENYTTCYEKIKKDLKVKLFCIDPSIQLRDALNRCKAAIFFSATMTPMKYFRQILGCAQGANRLALPSPFPGENLRLFISDRVSTLYRQREDTKIQISQTISALINQRKGNYLVFFPSYEYMQMVHEVFISNRPLCDHILQTPSMSESERDDFLQLFRQDNPKTLVGFAVMGGIFGEGIDLVGKRLSGAVVVGVGLPGISLERELIREYFADTINAGFEYAYQYPGINRVLQAAGRVIRSEADRGVVLLIDQRYATFRYRSLLLKQWATISVQNHRQLAEELENFWQAAK